MDHNLIDKYWEGQTSTQEEEQLLNDMVGSSSPEAAYFAMISAARLQKSNLTIKDIQAYNQKQQSLVSGSKILPLYRWIASAAAILVFVISGAGLWNYSHQMTQPVQMAETFDDPYEAYAEVREALAFVSSKLNKSQGEAMLNIKKAGEYAEIFK